MRCTISIDEDMYRCLATEESSLPRSTVSINKKGIVIDATDAVALRASANSIIKMMVVHEKMKGLK